MGQLTFSDINVTITMGKQARVTGKWKLKLTKESPGGGFTLTFRKIESGWKIVKDVTTSDDAPPP